MEKLNGKTKWTIIAVCASIFFGFVMLATKIVTYKVMEGIAEQKNINNSENNANKIKQTQYEMLKVKTKNTEQDDKLNKLDKEQALIENNMEHIKKIVDSNSKGIKEIIKIVVEINKGD